MTDQNAPVSGKLPPESRTILNVYAVLCLSMVISLVPNVAAATAFLVLFLGGMIYAYVVRAKAPKDSLTADHMTYLIRTIWIGSFFTMITFAIGAGYMLGNITLDALNPCMTKFAEGAAMLEEGEMLSCLQNFITANKFTLFLASAIAIVPILLYFFYRIAKGLNRAVKGHRIGNLKHWF